MKVAVPQPLLPNPYPMNILLVNLHSSHNAGDHALTLEGVRQLREAGARTLVLAMNDPASYEEGEETVPSFNLWMMGAGAHGKARWRWVAGPLALAQALVAALGWRLSRRLPRLGLNEEQHRLVRAYTEADAVVSCAGNFLYSSGVVGVPFMLAIFTMAYAWLLGKPLAALPQSVGPLQRGWERALVRWLVARMTPLLVREPRSLALVEALGVGGRARLLPDIAFAYPDAARDEALVLLQARLGPHLGTVPLLGITMMNWGAQSRHFQRQSQYEAAVSAAIRRFLEETNGEVCLFAQVWGPTEGEDDRVPARRVAAALAHTGRVHLFDEPLHPATLKGCYGEMALLLGTRMHSNIFAMSMGTPVLAVGYRTKTWGIMETVGLQAWVLDIEEATEATLPARLMTAWAARDDIRSHLATTLPTIIQAAGAAGEAVIRGVRRVHG